MRLTRECWFWLALAAAGAALERMGVWLIFLLPGAFCAFWLVEIWRNHKFNRELARMAREVKERGNVQ